MGEVRICDGGSVGGWVWAGGPDSVTGRDHLGSRDESRTGRSTSVSEVLVWDHLVYDDEWRTHS